MQLPYIPELTMLYKDFFNSKKSAGIILIACTLISIILTNSIIGAKYVAFWHYQLGPYSLIQWVNDGLMAVFFLLIGLEIEREIYVGELSSAKKALTPIIVAIGGMAVPAMFYIVFNINHETAAGFGIPMATDIAFSLGILSLLGNRVPHSIKIFLTAFAIIDDLGAILIIAFFYTESLSLLYLGLAVLTLLAMIFLNIRKFNILWIYILLGAVLWYFLHHSGIHATIAGVLTAFAIPFRKGKNGEDSLSERVEHHLHKPVAFIIMPVFALANTCILIQPEFIGKVISGLGFGIIFGLLLGKPIGIYLFAYIASKMKVISMPMEIKGSTLIGIGFLGGIGFTMSIFIGGLAFTDEILINTAKISIILASLLSGLIGYIILLRAIKRHTQPN
jgi:NhaA family Na+:H+ antiporter